MVLHLALRSISKKRRSPSKEWHPAVPHLVVIFGERLTPMVD